VIEAVANQIHVAIQEYATAAKQQAFVTGVTDVNVKTAA
jgi:hypothetical protein